MSDEAIAGSLVGFLRLDIKDFEAGIAKAQAIAKNLDAQDVDVKVRVDTAMAEAKLATVAKEADKADKSNTKLAQSSHDAGRGMGAMATAVITLGPALVPLAVGATGLAAGFGAMGAAGIFAVVGIHQEMAKGSALGGAYTGMLGTLKGDLTTLGHTAAGGVLSPFQDSVAGLQTRMPELNTMIGEFSIITGKTAGGLATGLVASFIALEPLMRDVGVYTEGLSTRFAAMMTGPGVVTFGDYVRSVFPQVMVAVESIVGSVVHLVAALAPLGLGTLGILRTFADLINAIPVDVLATLATTAGSVYLGFKSFGLLSTGISGVGTALTSMGISAESAAVGVRSLTIAAGAIGAVIAVATFLFTANAEAQRQNQQAVDDYADALRRSNGVIDESIRQTAFKTLQDQGAIDAAKALGINLGLVTDAALHQGDALSQVNAVIKDARINHRELYGATQTLTAALSTNNTELSAAVLKNKDLAEATQAGVTTTDAATAAQQRIAAEQKTTSDALAVTTQKMQDQGDAAGLLRQALDKLSGKKMSKAETQNQFEQAGIALEKSVDQNAAGADSANAALTNADARVVNAQRALANAKGAKKPSAKTIANAQASLDAARRGRSSAAAKASDKNADNSTAASLTGDSDNAVKNRGNVLSYVKSAQSAAEAFGGPSGSAEESRKRLVILRDEIIKNAKEWGFNKAEVTKFVDSVLTIPKTLPKTQPEIDLAAAAAQVAAYKAMLAGIPRTLPIGLYLSAGLSPAAAVAAMGSNDKRVLNKYAAGGIESHVAQIGGGASRVWNEPETGGEAYIPLAASKRARSRAIWEETGHRLGAQTTTNQTTITHTGNIVANDPDEYAAAIQRRQRLAALGSH